MLMRLGREMKLRIGDSAAASRVNFSSSALKQGQKNVDASNQQGRLEVELMVETVE